MSAAIKLEKRLINCNEIPHLWYEFDNAARCLGRGCQLGLVDRQNDTGCPPVQDDPGGRSKVMVMAFWIAWTKARFGIHALDNGKPGVCYMSKNRDRTKQSRRVVDQI